ncbi:hypothetical protein ES288_A11G379500v1 [Gossypium darwinii]|uniref:Rx N-terminal domain-containing protein n=1 Tax=Gossypium darwinii TaxID=34276 RepID=A0A5D2EUT0_GOSDA|nr:hypothetical protein ES288_A11G379500v1 [Gossypium darwinii]
MAEAIAFDLAVELITKLSSFTLSQIGLWWHVKDDLDHLNSTISTIKAVLLDAEERSVTSQLVKDWLEKLKYVLYDADDLLDDFSTEVLRKDLMGGNRLTQFAYGLRMGRQIKAIKARLTSIESEANMFNLVERDRPVKTSFMSKKRQQTHSFKDKIIGRDDDKAALLKLMFEFERKENVYVIPILGFGGLGKTALAQFIYNDEIVKNSFELMMFVCVSNVFDVKIIVENIIKSATGQAPNQNLELDQLQKQLLEKIELLVGGAKGSRIIVITRSWRVAKITSKCQPYVLKGLSDDDAWSLLKEIAFEQRYADSTNSAFVEIRKQISKRCSGVPLVIRTIASTLSFKETENEWRSFKDNELARIYQNEGTIITTLKLSYDHLPSHLKHCFAYCRLYSNDHEIHVQTLVQFWVAQGFIKQLNRNQSLDEIGLGYFKDLVERSFFQEVEEDENWGMTCKMHDLMHDLAESVAGTESSIVDSNEIASEVELYDLNLNAIPHSIYKLKHLRYLDLPGNFYLKSLPNSICKIQNLQALKLDWCRWLEELPKKIEKLVNLTHLAFRGFNGLTHMPRGIGKLTSLETLSRFVVDKDSSHDGADLSELSRLNNLRGQLTIANFGFVKNAKEKFRAANLKEKQHLRSLVLEWNGGDDDDDKSLEDLQPHPNLKKLVVDGWRGDAKFPSWLSLLTNLVDIKIWGPSKFKHFPSLAQLPCLQDLVIYFLDELEYMDDNIPSGREGNTEPFFPSLKVLSLRHCPNMKSWWRTAEAIGDDSNKDDTTVMGTSTMAFYECLQHLTSLKKLTIGDCKEVDLEGMQWEALKNLSHLVIDNIPQLVSLPLGIQHLVQLKTLEICNCSGLRSLFPVFQHLTFLEEFSVRNCKELELSAPNFQIFQDHTSLRSLRLQNIPKCSYLPEWLQHLTNLQQLYLLDFPNLTSLPHEMRCRTRLESLQIERVLRFEERCRKHFGADWRKIGHIPFTLL